MMIAGLWQRRFVRHTLGWRRQAYKVSVEPDCYAQSPPTVSAENWRDLCPWPISDTLGGSPIKILGWMRLDGDRKQCAIPAACLGETTF